MTQQSLVLQTCSLSIECILVSYWWHLFLVRLLLSQGGIWRILIPSERVTHKEPILLLLLLFTPLEFFTSALPDGFSLEFEWQKISSSQQDSFSILVVFNNVVVWMVSTRPTTSKSSNPFSNPLVTVPNAPITIGIIFTRMFYSFFNSLARSVFSPSFNFILLFSNCFPPLLGESLFLS